MNEEKKYKSEQGNNIPDGMAILGEPVIHTYWVRILVESSQ